MVPRSRACNGGFHCGKCGQSHAAEYWSYGERYGRKTRGSTLVCKVCRSLGYRPQALMDYTCQTCMGVFGSLGFPWPLMRRYLKDGRSTKLQCLTCFDSTLITCAECSIVFADEHMCLSERRNHKRRGALLICKYCRNLGFYGKDLKGYTWTTCTGVLGAKCFDRHDVRKHRRASTKSKLVCLQCIKNFEPLQLACMTCRLKLPAFT